MMDITATIKMLREQFNLLNTIENAVYDVALESPVLSEVLRIALKDSAHSLVEAMDKLDIVTRSLLFVSPSASLLLS